MSHDRSHWLSVAVILTVTVAAYGPLVYGVLELSARTTQAVNAFLLLGFAALEALIAARRTARGRFEITTYGILLFSASCLSLAMASVTGLWPLSILGLCLNIAALLSFGFGRDGARLFHPTLLALGCAVALLVFVPQYDSLLRMTAARGSAAALNLVGVQTQVSVRVDPFEVSLVVDRGLSVFDVATECNGFGIILSSVVLALIVSGRRSCALGTRALLGIAAAGVGLIFNIVRIVAISLASMNTMVDYTVIHEGLGTLVYVAALWGVWGMVWLAGRKHPRTADGAQSKSSA